MTDVKFFWNLPFDSAQGPEPVEGEFEMWNFEKPGFGLGLRLY
jgi:hypothetical protein